MLLNHTARVLVAAATPAEFGDLFTDLAGNAVIVSDRLVRDDLFTSAVAYQFELPFHFLNKSSEKLTRHIPGVDPRLLEKLDNRGIARLGSKLEPGDVLIGKTWSWHESGRSQSEQGLITGSELTDASMRDDSLYYDLLDPGIVCAVQLFGLWRYECGACGPVGHSGEMTICPYCAGPLDNLRKDKLSEGEVVRVKVDVLVRRELRVGDVLDDGRGNQLVVARIVPAMKMPLIKESPVDVCIHTESSLATELKEEITLRYPSTANNGESERSVRFAWTKLKKTSVQMEQKLTARGRGPHSLISQFPLASGTGNVPQRLTRKASRALFRAGYRNNLLELLTVKSDALDACDKCEEALAGGQPIEITPPETSSRLEKTLNCLGLTFVLSSSGVKKMLPNEVDAFQVLGATAQDVRSWSFGEVKKPETINYRTYRPEKDGLFCERIFGPEKDLECACGKYSGVKYKGMICDRCGVKVTDSRVRRKRMGHIELACPVVHRWFSHSESKPSKLSCLLGISQLELEQVIDHQSFVVTNPGTSSLSAGQVLNQELHDDVYARFSTAGIELDTGPQAVRWLLHSKNLHWLQWIVLDAIAVLPPDLRPLVMLPSGEFATSDLNDLYRGVVNRSNHLKKLVEMAAPEVIIRNEKRELQKAVDALFANCRSQDPVTDDNGRPLVCLTKHLVDLLKQLEKKPVDYSGRAVVVPNVGQQPNTLGLPELMVYRLFRAAALRPLIDWGHAKNTREAQSLLEKKPQPAEVKLALEDALARRSVLVLTEDAQAAVFRPVLIPGEAIQLHPVTASRLGLRFSGEQLVLHVPLCDAANQELAKPQHKAEPSSELVLLNVEKLVQIALEPGLIPLTEYDRILLGIDQLH